MTAAASTTVSCDVAVVGGGAAGFAAAMAAAAAGAKVVLVESAPYLGGAATVRTVATYCGLWSCSATPVRVVSGVADQVLDGLKEIGGVSGRMAGPAHAGLPGLSVVATDAESIKSVLDRLIRGSRVDVYLGATLTAAAQAGDRFQLSVMGFGDAPIGIDAATVVDASGDSTAAWLLDADTVHAADGVRQTSTMSVRYGGIPADADVSTATLQSAIAAAKQAGADHLTSTTGFSVRVPISNDLVAYLADEDGDPLVPADYTEATVDARRQARAYLDVIRTLPDCANAYIVGTGPELGVRESRHLVSSAPLLDASLRGGTIGDDTVALCGWPSEYHPGAGKPSIWTAVGGAGAWGISLDNLTSASTPGLFGAGRGLTGEHLAGTAARVMGTAFATGQAAGVAAALTASRRGGSGGLQVADVRHELTKQGATLSI